METRAVLFVDDDQIVLKSIEKSTTDESYDKYFAMSGEEALEIIKQQDVHVIVVDIVMPEMDGIDLLKIVKREYPDIVSVVLSGYTHPVNVMMSISDLGVYRFISKPWKFDEDFTAVIRRAIDHYNLLCEHNEIVGELKHCSG